MGTLLQPGPQLVAAVEDAGITEQQLAAVTLIPDNKGLILAVVQQLVHQDKLVRQQVSHGFLHFSERLARILSAISVS
jgi:hypothetical protein